MAVLSRTKSHEIFLGIDFGTTNSVVSVYLEDGAVTIPIDGNNIFPTAIMFEADLEEMGMLNPVFGVQAKEAETIYPESTVLDIKRHLGTNQKIKVTVESVDYFFTPVEITSQILSYLRVEAEKYLDEELGILCEAVGCVITVPANSTDKQKKMTKDAAILAGFSHSSIFLRLEPAAASITYALGETTSKNILVYDFGGGTFDACVINIEADGTEPQISILSTFGDNNLGGNDVDKLIMDIVYEQFKLQTNGEIDLFNEENLQSDVIRRNKVAIARLRKVSNQAKERLSLYNSTKITLAPFIQEPQIININIEVSREQFENHRRINKLDDTETQFERYRGKNLKDILNITLQCIDSCINVAGTSKIDEVFLVGGSSSISIITDLIKQKFNKIPFKSKISPALSISLGAASYADIITSDNTNGPKIKEKTIHPLGIEVSGRKFYEIVGSGIEIPQKGLTVESSTEFTTNHDDVTSIAIVVYEDTSPTEDKCVTREGMKRLAGTSLNGIPRAKRGEEKIKVSFTVSQDNILKVKAVSQSQGIETELYVDELY